MNELPPEIKQQLALDARNKIYGCVRELEQLREQIPNASPYWRRALLARAEQIDKDAFFLGLLLKRYTR